MKINNSIKNNQNFQGLEKIHTLTFPKAEFGTMDRFCQLKTIAKAQITLEGFFKEKNKDLTIFAKQYPYKNKTVIVDFFIADGEEHQLLSSIAPEEFAIREHEECKMIKRFFGKNKK